MFGTVPDGRVEVPHGKHTVVRLSAHSGSARSHSTSSTVIEGIIYQPNLKPPGPQAGKSEGGKGQAVNAGKSAHHSTPPNPPSSEPPKLHPSACVIEGDSGIEYYVGFDRAFAQVAEPGEDVGGIAEEHSNYFASYQQPTYSVGLR